MKYISGQELSDEGYLQEANRLFFHPLGLALEVTVDDDEEFYDVKIQDWRHDPEGVYFDVVNPKKVEAIENTKAARIADRAHALGFFVQQPEDIRLEFSDPHWAD